MSTTDALEAAVEVAVENLRQLAVVVTNYSGEPPTLIKKMYVCSLLHVRGRKRRTFACPFYSFFLFKKKTALALETESWAILHRLTRRNSRLRMYKSL